MTASPEARGASAPVHDLSHSSVGTDATFTSLGDAAADVVEKLSNGGRLAHDHIMTAEEAVALDFNPWTREWWVPSNDQWPEIGELLLPYVRMGLMMNMRTKEEMMEFLAGVAEIENEKEGDDHLITFCEGLRDAATFFKDFKTLTEVAESRVLVALSSMTIDPRYTHLFQGGDEPSSVSTEAA